MTIKLTCQRCGVHVYLDIPPPDCPECKGSLIIDDPVWIGYCMGMIAALKKKDE